MSSEPRVWKLLVCPECGHCEGLDVYDEVLLCPHSQEPTVMQSVEVVEASAYDQLAAKNAELFDKLIDAELNSAIDRTLGERLHGALREISALCQMEGGELAHRIWHEAEEALAVPIGVQATSKPEEGSVDAR